MGKKSENYVYIEKMAEEFGLSELPISEQKVILKELNEAFEERVIIECMNKLKQKDRIKLEKILDKTNDKRLTDFLIENIPNILSVFDKVYLDLKKELYDDVKI